MFVFIYNAFDICLSFWFLEFSLLEGLCLKYLLNDLACFNMRSTNYMYFIVDNIQHLKVLLSRA